MTERAAILTRGDGTPYVRPERSDYPEGTEGARTYLRAFHAYKDEIADDANRAFDAAFRKALREGE